MRLLYNIIVLISAPPVLLYFLLKMLLTGKYRRSFLQKLGLRQSNFLENIGPGPRLWMHAVSVGEVNAALPIVAELKKIRPDFRVIFSTSTETGQDLARKTVAGVDAFIYFPLDIPPVVVKMLDLVRPDVFAFVETELWPNFLAACRRRRVKVVMVNGRISNRSFNKYRRTGFFWRRILQSVDCAAMITQLDADRITQMGMTKGTVAALGNSKYDALAATTSPALYQEALRVFHAGPEEKFFVAGSTHPGEEKIIISVYQKLLSDYPEFSLILVPRDIRRAGEITGLLRQCGLPAAVTFSQMKNRGRNKEHTVVVVDVIGELFKIYSLATIAFCGGSMVRRGGHNLLEATAWGKVVFYGPFMDDFHREAALMEEAGAGIRVTNEDELLAGILRVLGDPVDLKRRGENGKAAVLANMGAAKRHAQMITGRIG
ncbi:MAG TPA: glycosyltransferase N-terminal domain-containing protein [Smithellaceae bacterium]|nr:glycosyltransferase N-terminal domain-containing protein [Smithellaceae bacterium]